MIINDTEHRFERLKKIIEKGYMTPTTAAVCYWDAISCLTENEIKKHAKKIQEMFRTFKLVEWNMGLQTVERREQLRKLALTEKAI